MTVRTRNTQNLVRRASRHLAALLASTALTVNPVLAGETLPTGASVASGSVSVSSSGSGMTVTQGSDKAIVNWNSFSIGASNSVTFVQPDRSSAILNRVTGSSSSTIAGSLAANGQVYLINPNGIAITSTGTVKVGGGFVASTLDITDKDFLDGNLNFYGNGASAGVSNEGIVTVGRGGYAALLGGTVKNSGLIAVPLGKAALGSGKQATLDLSGDGFLQVAMPTKDGLEGDGALVENSGKISADGGLVVMKAATARDAARQAINLSGIAEAKTISGKEGSIVLGGGDGGSVAVSGKVTATAKSGKGGKVTITGKAIALKGAMIDASGSSGGGTVKIGGDKQGKGDTQRAQTTTVDANTAIRADATGDGNGGNVVIWSDDLTTFAGTITAHGASTGNGGDAEVSGKALLSYTGYTDLSAANGSYGTLLLDPYNITITDDNGAGTSLTATGNDSTLSASTLEAALAGANVTVSTGTGGSQEGNIVVASNVSWSANTILTLQAAGSIAIDADITATGTSAGLVLTYGSGYDYSIASGASITLSGASASLAINGVSYTLIHSMDALDAIDSTGLSGNYALAEDLNASGTTYTSALVGSASGVFRGTFAGLGNTISGLTISGSGGLVGLFGYNTGTIRDIGLEGGSVSGTYDVGGLVGLNYGGAISNAYATVTVSGSSTGIGGLVGENSSGTITDSYATGTVSSSGYVVGGLAGASSGTITGSYATGTVSGGGRVGGLVGEGNGTFSNSYATGAVSGSSYYVGGLVGLMNGGMISNSYATGAVFGNTYVGGLVGGNYGTVANTYATGSVTGSGGVGGLVGDNYGTVTASYFDTETTGQAYGVGSDSSATGVNGLTTVEARDSSSYTDWDFGAVWYQSGDMRPILRSEAATAVNGVVPVSNLHQLALMGTDLSTTYILAGDIDASETDSTDDSSGIWGSSGWQPIGSSSSAFTGTLDGNGHTITGLTIGSSGGFVGLVGYNTGTIRDIGLEGGNASGTFQVGALAGVNSGTIRNAYATGAVSGTYDVGGLVGYNYGTITNAYATGHITGSDYVGGLVGNNDGGTITNAYATGTVTGGDYAGGLVGVNYTGTITNAYATGTVTGNVYVGGLVGLNYGTITASYFDTDTTGQASGVGANSGTADVTGLTTAEFQDTEYFMALASAAGWDFSSVWAPSSGGYYPELYALTPVVWVSDVTTTSTYGDSTGTQVATVNGASAYVFDDGGIPADLEDTAVSVDATTNAGTYSNPDLTTGNVTLTNANGVAYRVFYYDTDTQTVTPRSITVTADDASRTYGDGNPTLTYAVTSGSLINGDTLSGALSTSATTASNVGSYGIMQGTLANSNYDISYVGGTLTVTPRAITVTADDLSRTYGDGNPTLTYTVTSGSLVNDDSLSGSLATTATTASNVGSYGIAQGTLANSNYDITYVGSTLTVTPRAITVTADDLSRTYGDGNPTLTYAVTSGSLVNGDSLSGSLATTATTASNVGTYGITQGTLANSNYGITYVGGTLAVNKAALTVTADNGTMTYGDTVPSLGYTVSGWKNGQTAALLTNVNVGTDATSASSAGAGYTTTASGGTLSGAASGNYTITYVGGTFSVTPRAITLTADDLSRTYGDNNPNLTYTVNSGSLINGDTLSGALTTSATTASGIGSYSVTQGTLANSNYDISYVGGTLTVTLRSITITADELSRTYGDDNPDLTYAVTSGSLVNGDSLSGALATSATAASGVGSYAITQGTLAASSNYALTYVPATLTVTPGATVTPYQPTGVSAYIPVRALHLSLDSATSAGIYSGTPAEPSPAGTFVTVSQSRQGAQNPDDFLICMTAICTGSGRE